MSSTSKNKKCGNYIKNESPNLPTITMSFGNAKVSYDILIFNIPAIKTCPNNELCKDTCYARKAEKLYPSVLPCRENNYQASILPSFIDRMVSLISISIERYSVKAVRIHESGDFYSKDYANKWELIAKQIKTEYPDIVFFAYTKSNNRPISSINIVESILPGNELNYGSKEYVIKLAKKYHAVICPYGKTKQKFKCGDECKACQRKQRVVFIKH